jgi:hypothetical protein
MARCLRWHGPLARIGYTVKFGLFSNVPGFAHSYTYKLNIANQQLKAVNMGCTVPARCFWPAKPGVKPVFTGIDLTVGPSLPIFAAARLPCMRRPKGEKALKSSGYT